MQMEVVYLVKFQHVNKVYSDKLTLFYLYRMMHIVVRNGVHGIEVVFCIEVCVKAIHDHDHLISLRSRSLGINNVYAIKTSGDVLLKRSDMAMIWVYSESLGIKFIDEFASRINSLKYPIHLGLVDTVSVY